jgi:hypothetical protein
MGPSFWVPFLYRFGAQDRSLGGPFGQKGGSPGAKICHTELAGVPGSRRFGEGIGRTPGQTPSHALLL